MQDTELFELCKGVYEATKWTDTTQYLWVDDSFHSTHPEWDSIETASHNMSGKGIPLYTSDYLLEKLPKAIKRYSRFELTPTMANTRWSAGYWSIDRLNSQSAVSDTPLKSLLKLTLELHKKGLLDAKDN